MDLFESHNSIDESLARPLADRMRPKTLDELVGQEHLTAKGSLLQKAIEGDRVFSILLWGPPGCGKTTLAGIIANETKSEFVSVSAVLSGIKDIRQIIEQAKKRRMLYKKQTILFVDEIHRFNKAQQDAFLHHVEKGLITLVGATTQNPSFEVPDGDARIALANLETAVLHFAGEKQITSRDVETAIEKKSLLYDKAGEEHFNLISAFIKSMRGSDPDAAVYWLERMLMAGDDPYYMLRRMIRFATEDIGMADPGALTMALNAGESYRILGHPEGDDVLFQAAIYLATAPKSNAVYMAHKQVKKTIQKTGYSPVPLHIRNAPTKLMKDLDYGKGYKYAHDYKDAFAPQSFLPDTLDDRRFYFPTDRGYEKTVKQGLETWIQLKHKMDKQS